MDDQLKDKVLIASIVLAAVCLVLAISSGISASRNKTDTLKERTLRIETEEKLSGVSSQTSSLEADLKKTQEELVKANTSLNQENLANDALKTELDKVTQLKTQLEKDLKEALFTKSRQANK